MKIAYIEYSPNTESLDIFFCGCKPPHCNGCYNEELWNFNTDGSTLDECFKEIVALNHRFDSLINKIIVVGGEPIDCYHTNTQEFVDFIANIKKITNKPIFLFTRYNLDKVPNEVKEYSDYIKCGRYMPEYTTDDNIQYGIKLATSNQKIYKKGEDY